MADSICRQREESQIVSSSSASVTSMNRVFNFNAGPSSLWGNELGNWSAPGGIYVPGSIPNADTYLPFPLTDFTVHVDTTLVGEGGVWLRALNTPGTGVLFVVPG